MPTGAVSPLRSGRKGSVDLRLNLQGGVVVGDDSGGAGAGAGRALTMAELAELVSNDQRDGGTSGSGASNMALLFTDAAHTVFQ
jgi:hypothetical protein